MTRNSTKENPPIEPPKKRWIEPVVAVLMSFATLATAWSSYQSAAWTRVSNRSMNEANTWLAQKPFENPAADPHPFVPALYTPRGAAEAAQHHTNATRQLTASREAGNFSGQFLANTVLFATVLFFAAMTTKFEQQRVRLVTVFLAIALFGFAVVRTLSLPTPDKTANRNALLPSQFHHWPKVQ